MRNVGGNAAESAWDSCVDACHILFSDQSSKLHICIFIYMYKTNIYSLFFKKFKDKKEKIKDVFILLYAYG